MGEGEGEGEGEGVESKTSSELDYECIEHFRRNYTANTSLKQNENSCKPNC